ncbi:putative f0f1-atpase subunit ca2+/mg2+ transporter [Lucifera butyrica]|uniref:Putative f0f1-atpase subunit ca2+/mg2+ transporter n=1 Tax=Lucifera butyrica TaxID=1351585 RepID=A0A498RD83_9FIRM|nr:AtpZ/AtpI family protein [Lucifera butyrica]VBB08925.1 putative f0f1-atpase subunit ca2+/mg2+ transporter [Lucifera butyrica]
MREEDKGQMFSALATAGSIGFIMAANVLVGLAAGHWTDKWLNTSPWFSVLGIVLGMVAGLWTTYKRIVGKS